MWQARMWVDSHIDVGEGVDFRPISNRGHQADAEQVSVCRINDHEMCLLLARRLAFFLHLACLWLLWFRDLFIYFCVLLVAVSDWRRVMRWVLSFCPGLVLSPELNSQTPPGKVQSLARWSAHMPAWSAQNSLDGGVAETHLLCKYHLPHYCGQLKIHPL